MNIRDSLNKLTKTSFNKHHECLRGDAYVNIKLSAATFTTHRLTTPRKLPAHMWPQRSRLPDVYH